MISCYGPAISRNYGALVALHGDDKGLVLPWDVAPVHIIIVPIFYEKNKDEVIKKCKEIKEKLKVYEVKLDDRNGYTPGWKFNHWEMKGVPIRIEVGPKDLEKKTVTIFRRDINKKTAIKENLLLKEVERIKNEFTKNMIKKAESQFKENIVAAKSLSEIKKVIVDKIVKVDWCSIAKDGEKCAEVVEKDIQASVRGKRVDEKEKPKGNCVICGRKANEIVYIARSY